MVVGQKNSADTGKHEEKEVPWCSRCHLCEEQTETVNHQFLHRKWADQLKRLFIWLRKIR